MKVLSEIKIHRTNESIIVKSIETATHNCFEYVRLKLFISESKEIIKLSRQAHVVNNLRVKFLMKMNILESKEIILNLRRRKMTLTLCDNVKVDIRITTIAMNVTSINRVILIERLVFISAKFIVSVSIRMKKTLLDRDFLFQSISRELNLELIDDVMTHVVDAHTTFVQIANSTDKLVMISRKTRLDRIMNYEEHECYVTNSSKTSLTAKSF